MSISDVAAPEVWVAALAFVCLAVAAQAGGVVLVDPRTLGVDASVPATAAVVATMLALWWFDRA